MLKPQKKVTKKEIKEDKLVTTYFETRTWMEENRRLVSYLIGVPVALIVVFFLWNQKKNEWNETATTQLAKILPYYDDGKYDQAVNGVVQEGTQGLQAIVNEYGSTKAGEMAKLYLANSYFALENYDKAMEYYKDVDLSDRMLSASALAGVAACYEAKGNHEDAAAFYEKAASKDMSTVQAPDNLQRAAVNYAAAGKKDKAVVLLKTLKKEFPNSPVARDIDRYIAEYAS